MGQLGIENIKKEVNLCVTLVKIIQQARADGKVDAADLALLMQLVPVIGPAAESLEKVVPEFKDMDAADGAALTAYVMTSLAVEDTKAAKIVEKSLKLALCLYELEKAITAPKAV